MHLVGVIREESILADMRVVVRKRGRIVRTELTDLGPANCEGSQADGQPVLVVLTFGVDWKGSRPKLKSPQQTSVAVKTYPSSGNKMSKLNAS